MAYQQMKSEGNKTRAEITENIDMSKVDAIVSRIKLKYEKQGIITHDSSNDLKELKSLISEGTRAKIDILNPKDLKYSFNPFVRKVGKIYIKFKSFFGFFAKKVLGAFPESKLLSFELYSANINYSASQYLAIVSVILFFSTIILTGAFFAIFLTLGMSFIIPLLLAFFVFIFSLFFAMKYPSLVAKKRAKQINMNLPFALRHMATLLRAGMSLYKVIRTVAVADYGVLAEELNRTVMEVEEGADVKDALRALSLRTKSYPLKTAIRHILRALKSGGNLSDSMTQIADDVSHQLLAEINTFSGKMNFFGVIYIFVGIVIPVMLAILSGIRNAPLGTSSFFSALPLTPTIIAVSFLVVFPFILLGMLLYIKSIKPNM